MKIPSQGKSVDVLVNALFTSDITPILVEIFLKFHSLYYLNGYGLSYFTKLVRFPPP